MNDATAPNDAGAAPAAGDPGTAGSGPAAGDAPPEGFVALPPSGAYFDTLGTVHGRREGEHGMVLGVRVGPRHANITGVAHGGMLATLADSALGVNIARARKLRSAQVTVTLNLDFLSSALQGDWLEAHVRVTRIGSRLGFADCELRVGDRIVLRATGVFAFVDRPLPERRGVFGPPADEDAPGPA